MNTIEKCLVESIRNNCSSLVAQFDHFCQITRIDGLKEACDRLQAQVSELYLQSRELYLLSIQNNDKAES
jgi:hypothetical protein